MGDWLYDHWYQVSVLVALALIAINTARSAAYAAGPAYFLRDLKRDIEELKSEVGQWHGDWDDRELRRKLSQS